MGNPTKKLKKADIEAQQPLEKPISARGLEGAYSDDEPEYTLDALVAVNPDYKGTREACNTTARAPACSDEPKSTIKRKERNERA